MLPSSNIRGFFEILMPGVFLVLNVALTIFIFGAIFITPDALKAAGLASLALEPVAAVALLIVFGYPVGMALRLLRTEGLDAFSAGYIRFFSPKARKTELCLTEHFFYRRWMLEKINQRLPSGMLEFFDTYWDDKYTDDGRTCTTFFNLCKTIIARADEASGSEVYAAEASNRFLAGSVYALVVSVVLLMAALGVSIYHRLLPWEILTGSLSLGYLILAHIILLNFRLLRAKEVDTVFNAAFANRKAFDRLFPTPASRHTPAWLDENQSKAQTAAQPQTQAEERRDLLYRAWTNSDPAGRGMPSVNLDTLIETMQAASQAHPHLASLYFAGSEVDHPYFLNNRTVAIGISVLPEDARKAGRQKQHPLQSEIIIALRGSVCVHYEKDGIYQVQELAECEHFVIPPNTCHWVSAGGDGKAAFMFIKTNPSEEPRGMDCGASPSS